MEDTNKKDQNIEDSIVFEKNETYEKPAVKTEELMTFGALCNGNAIGGRKASTASPDFCSSNKLLS
ncbi:MAG: hypothetical protein HOO06_08550 [Bdellovibrionaceae bacterium]|jgi:hypothetical protein|nr:hypothetical protein [Pseudobdellovibrionaceae bacterium]